MHAVSHGNEAIALMNVVRFSAVVTDVHLPGASGVEVLAAARTADPTPEVVIVTGYGNVEEAVKAMRAGAFDYLEKPIDGEALKRTVARALERHRLVNRTRQLEDALEKTSSPIIGISSQIIAIRRLIEKVAPMPVGVLIRGETGTGKEVVAGEIHRLYGRGTFVPMNCGAIPADLLESELFGVSKGAFTGASTSRDGLIAAADGGTLFLDEIGDMPLELQVKLNRVLESGEVRKVGDTRSHHYDVRVIAATHRDLDALIKEGKFRSDLYYRLNVVQIDMPPLREREGDVALLSKRFLRRSAARFGTPPRSLSPAALSMLEAAPWPGNVRELMNVMERVSAMAPSEVVEPRDLPVTFQNLPKSDERGTYRQRIDEAKRQVGGRYLVELMRRYRGNVSKACVEAGMDRVTLHRVLRDHGIDASIFRH